eukprot:1138052-Pelagomonas_calceolata.AAC.4
MHKCIGRKKGVASQCSAKHIFLSCTIALLTHGLKEEEEEEEEEEEKVPAQKAVLTAVQSYLRPPLCYIFCVPRLRTAVKARKERHQRVRVWGRQQACGKAKRIATWHMQLFAPRKYFT